MTELSELRCVILGGGGFIGTNLCRGLQGRVAYLRAFGRRRLFPDAIEGVEWIEGDFEDIKSMTAAVGQCDTVVHLVGATTPESANIDKIGDLTANVIPTLHLLEACRELNVRRVIFVSSASTVYGIPAKLPTPETAMTLPMTAYGISKLAIEKYLALYHYLHRLQFCVLRVANPYGPYQLANKGQGVIAAFLRRILAGKPVDIWGDGSVVRDYIYIDDTVNALTRAMTYEGPHQIFNIGSGTGRNLIEILNSIQRILDRTVEVNYHEGRAIDVPSSFLDITRAANEVRWGPQISFEDGLERTIAWLRDQAAVEAQ